MYDATQNALRTVYLTHDGRTMAWPYSVLCTKFLLP